MVYKKLTENDDHYWKQDKHFYYYSLSLRSYQLRYRTLNEGLNSYSGFIGGIKQGYYYRLIDNAIVRLFYNG